MSGKRGALISGLIFCLALAIWFIDENRIQTAALQKTVRETIVPIAAGDVSELALRNPWLNATLVKRDGKWAITQPQVFPADQDVLLTLLTNWCNGRRGNEFEPDAGMTLADFGLEQPQFEIRFQAPPPNERRTAIAVGNQTSNGDYYAMEQGTGRVFILSEHLRNNLAKNLYHLRDKRLFDFDIEQAAAVRIETTSHTLTLERANGNWRITAPFDYPAEPDTVRSLLGTFNSVQASDFATSRAEEVLKIVGLDDPVGAVEVQLANSSEPLRLEFGNARKAEKRIWARRIGKPEVAQLDFQYLPKLFIDPTSFRRQHVFSLPFEQLVSVAVKLGKSDFMLARTNGQWTMAGQPEFAVDPLEVSARLGELLDLRVVHFVARTDDDLSTFGLAQPRMRLTLGAADGAATETLLVGRINPQDKLEIFAKTAELPDVFALSVLDPQKFYWTQDDFRLKRLFDFAPDQIAKVEFTLTPFPAAEIVKTEQAWQLKLDAGRGKNIPASDAQGLLESLSELRYETALSKPPLDIGSTGITTPTLTISAFGADGELLGRLDRSAMKNEEYYATKNNSEWFKMIPLKFLRLEAAIRGMLPEKK